MIVENAIGLLKSKWRRLHHHVILEKTREIPGLILCASILHNLCLDNGCVQEDEDIPRTPADKHADQIACGMANADVNANADQARDNFKAKRRAIAAMWLRIQDATERDEPNNLTIFDYRQIYGDTAYM